MAKKLSDDDRERIYQLCQDGHKQKKVADFYGVSQGTISQIVKEQGYKAEIKRRDAFISEATNKGIQSAIEELSSNSHRMIKTDVYED